MTEDELWQLAFKKLIAWTAGKHRVNHADAQEMVQEAARLFVQAGAQVDTTDPQVFLKNLGSKINGIAVNRRRKQAELAVRLTNDGIEPEPKDSPHAEQQIIDAQIAQRALTALLDRIGDDKLLVQIVDLMLEGVENPADQAKAMGCDVREVYNARRRLNTHVEAVKQSMEK